MKLGEEKAREFDTKSRNRSWDYAALPGRGEPRGLKSGGSCRGA